MKHARKPKKPKKSSAASKERRGSEPSRDKSQAPVLGPDVAALGGVTVSDRDRQSNTNSDEAPARSDLGGCDSAQDVSGSSEGQSGSESGDGGSDRGSSTAANGNHHATENGSDVSDSVHQDESDSVRRVTYRIELKSTEDHLKQHEFIYSDKKRKIIRAGRRGGKTTGSATLAVLTFMKGKGVDYAAPVIEQVEKFWLEVCIALAEPIEYGVMKKYEGSKRIEVPGTQQYIQCWTAWNPDTLRGGSTDLLILDEFQMMQEDTWKLAGAPRLIDRNGDAVFIYTPPSLRMRAKTMARDPMFAAKMFKSHLNDPRWLCLHFTSHDNPHISKAGLSEVSSDLTQLGYRQEIMAEDIDQVPGALWNQKMLDETRVEEIPPEALPLVRIVVGVDPSGSSTNEAGIICAAQGKNGHGYVISDKSLLAPSPRSWGQAAVWEYWERRADRIVGERNYGGDMVREIVTNVDGNVSYKDVTASRGKQVRAEPICALYEKGIIHHVGVHEKLEEEMCSYVPGQTVKSPNRMDAQVWALTDLFPEAVRLTLVDAILEQHEQKVVEMKKQIVENKQEIGKVLTNDKTPRCEDCGSTLLVKRGPLMHCNHCGANFGTTVLPVTVGGRAALQK